MKKLPCGCRFWETDHGDTEEYMCPEHEAEEDAKRDVSAAREAVKEALMEIMQHVSLLTGGDEDMVKMCIQRVAWLRTALTEE